MKPGFFNFSLYQTVNQWLCILFVLLMGFCVILYYLVQKAQDVGDFYVSATFRAGSGASAIELIEQ